VYHSVGPGLFISTRPFVVCGVDGDYFAETNHHARDDRVETEAVVAADG
jgi:hypothetical protein